MKLILNYAKFFIRCILFMIIILPCTSFSNPSFFQKCKKVISQMIKQRSLHPVQSRYLQSQPHAKNLHQLKKQHEKATLQEDQYYYQAIQNFFHLQSQQEEATESEHIQQLEEKIAQARKKIDDIYNNNLENKMARLNEIRHLEEKPLLTKEEISQNDQMYNLLQQVIGDSQ